MLINSFRVMYPAGVCPKPQLVQMFNRLDEANWNDAKLEELLKASGALDGGNVDYETFIRFILPNAAETAEWTTYLEKHALATVIAEALAALQQSRAVCPLEFLSNFFGTKADEKEPEGLHKQETDAKKWRENMEAEVEAREKDLTPRGNFKVLMVDVNEAALHALERCGQVDVRPKMTEDDLVSIIGNYDALVCRSSVAVTPKIIDAAVPKLQMIALSQVGMDNVPIEYCAEKGVRVCNSPVGNTVTTAEHTLALIFSMVRRVPAADQTMRSGVWAREPFMGNQLSGNVLGLLGLGNIAFHVAKGAHAMGMKIVAYDPFAPQEKADSINATLYRTQEELSKVAEAAKVLSIHVPLTKDTKGLIGKEFIGKMQKGSYIVNCARGGIVDEDALAEALQSGHLAGAASDVFVREKAYVDAKAVPGDFCLVKAPNAVLTPHLGAMTIEAQVAVAEDAAIQVEEFLLKKSEPKYGIVKGDADNPGKLKDVRPAWMK